MAMATRPQLRNHAGPDAGALAAAEAAYEKPPDTGEPDYCYHD
jgi:hypothetical protein